MRHNRAFGQIRDRYRPTSLVRSTLGAMAMVVVMLWQVAYVQPVSADDCIPIGGGLVICGGGGPQGGPPIVVTGPEDNVIQGTSHDASDPNDKSASASWGWIEQEGKAYVAAIHQVDVNKTLTDNGRDEIRAYIFGRLLQIAQKPANQRTAQEQAAYYHFQKLIQAKKIEAAQGAVNEYNHWASNPCGFLWPASITANTHEYVNRDGVIPYCTGDPLATLFGHPAPPTREEFTAVGNAMAYSALAANADATRVAQEFTTGGVFLGGLTAAAAAAAIAALIVLSIPAVSSIFVTGGALVIFPFAAYGTAAAAAGGAAAGVGALTAALGIASVVAIVILFAVVTAIAIWQTVTEAQIPIDLNTTLTDAQNNPPDLGAMAGKDDGVAALFGSFLPETLPDYPERRTGSPSAHQNSDPNFLMSTPIPSGGDITLPNADSIAPLDWDGVAHTAYLTGGWWADQPAGGSNKLSLRLKYVDWSGQHWTAAVAGDTFIHSHDGHPGDTYLSPDIKYTGAGNAHFTATWHGNRRPMLSPAYTGTLSEGHTLSFHANPSDPDAALPGGDPVSVQWLFQPSDFANNVYIQPSDGRPLMDHCLDDPIGTTWGTSALLTCPWNIVIGPDATFSYQDNGTFHVRVVVTDSHGATAEESFTVPIANSKPAVTLTDPTAFSINEGGGVTVAGSFNEPGDDQVSLNVDWGDGTSTTKYYPCEFGPIDFVNCNTFTLPMPPADHPTNFSLDHTYLNDPPGSTSAYAITVTTTDDDGGTDTASGSAAVANVVPTMDINCGYDHPIGPLEPGCIAGGDTRYGHPGDDVTVNGRFVDPGTPGETHTLHMDWGDGTTEDFAYPCPGGSACPFQLDSTMGLFLPGPGIVYWHLTHSYATTGTFTIGATVTDGDGGSVSGGTDAKITPSPTPTVVITTPSEGGVYRFGRTVLANYACAAVNGISTCIGTVANGAPINTATVGPKSFTVSALSTDNLTFSRTHHYAVVYAFRFIRTTFPYPTSIPAHAGKTVPIEFSLGADAGRHILTGAPMVQRADCGTGVTHGVATALRTWALVHAKGTAKYRILWKSQAKWVNSCRSVTFTLNDGTQHQVLFNFVQ